jgi:lipopolysaccharide/colanic/teichoic acid biosynthesis glycosyltransferase
MDLSAQARRAPAQERKGAPRQKEKIERVPDSERQPRPADGVRRAVDVVVALALLVLTAPLLALGMAVVALAAGRPLFFGHERLGKGGKTFRCWKLRTMRVDAEKVLELRPELRRLHRQHDFKLPASRDPRILPGGRWLRRTHLDELPQLFNVLVGDMSLVGPRPIVRDELAHFGKDARVLLSTRPGIFGEWTSRGRSRPAYPERARIEIDWVRRRSLARDLRILLRSVAVVLRGQEEG